jgi:hypothetical protein
MLATTAIMDKEKKRRAMCAVLSESSRKADRQGCL